MLQSHHLLQENITPYYTRYHFLQVVQQGFRVEGYLIYNTDTDSIF